VWEKVVLNLLSNALKHTFEGGIWMTMRWLGDHAELAIAPVEESLQTRASGSLKATPRLEVPSVAPFS
jgi:hypothetical protein